MKRFRTGTRLSVLAYDRTGTEKLAEGTLETVDNQIDTTTGTVKLRAQFANADGSLFPNQFVNITLLADTLHDVVTVPSAAVQTGIPGTFVYRANADNTVSLRKITVGPSAGARVAVLSGLDVGERVVVDGVDHLSDGARIRIQNVSGTSATTATTP